MSAPPPVLAERLLEWMLPDGMREAYIGDLTESFSRRAASEGDASARRWYWMYS